ncbi:hypothetical protein AX16_002055 [Volvariella volvacea WC 439]|nr:hypothetical protein AX16_002055 [Volvariella volvacea WC 439]
MRVLTTLSLTLFCALLSCPSVYALQIPAEDLASQYSLTTSTHYPFPTETLNSGDTQSLLQSQWGLGKGRIQDGANNLDFVDDPFPNTPAPGTAPGSTNGPVLRVTYPQGSFSHDSGGSQLYTLWNSSDGSPFQTMIVSYEVAFEGGFDWVKGGKLPGLRGGLDSTGCSGGNEEQTGTGCFSSRVMWRRSGTGEVYAYIPTPNGLCSSREVICNDDFGTSLARGSFGFETRRWNRITMLLQLNDPPNVANGNLQLFFNDIQAMSRQDLQIRSVSSLSINGLYLSTFFGGSDESWATPITAHTYFRNFQLWGGSSPSNFTGEQVSAAFGTPPIRCVELALATLMVLVLLNM